MGQMIGEQLLSLLISMLLGVMLGLLYDLFRPLRYSFGKIAAAVCDFICCLAAAFVLFIIIMRSEKGMPGTWKVVMLGMGAIFYFCTMSQTVLRILDKMHEKFCHILNIVIAIFKKLSDFAKFYFQKTKKCFIIKK